MVSETEQKDIQIVKKNCKNSNYHIQKASKYGGKSGHVILFEAMGIVGADATQVSCTVDVCLVNTRELFRNAEILDPWFSENTIHLIPGSDILKN